MIAPLLKLGGWITDHPKIFCLLLFLAGGLLGVLAGRRMCATPTIKEEATATTAAIAASTQDTKTQAGPWTREEWDYGDPIHGWDGEVVSRGLHLPPLLPGEVGRQRGGVSTVAASTAAARAEAGPPQAPQEGPLVRYVREEHGPTASETHATAESAQSTTQTLHLEQQGSLAPQWALSVGFENLLHDKALRLSVRRKFLGPIWVEGAFTPATRAVGAGISIQF